MATKMKSNSSVVTAVDVTDGTCAAVESDPATSALAPKWVGLRDKADGLAETERKLNREVVRARSRLNVQDSLWDTTVAAFGRAVVDASGGRRSLPPYTRFFVKVTPSAAQELGTDKEIELATSWLAELARDPSEALAQTWTARLKTATDGLQTACTQRDQAVAALGPHHTSVALLVGEVNAELDRLEGDLKKLFPGDANRVASYLAATRSNYQKGKGEAPAPAPASAAK
jgi:hypothetical protein